MAGCWLRSGMDIGPHTCWQGHTGLRAPVHTHRGPLQPRWEWGTRLAGLLGKGAALAEITSDKENKGPGNNPPLSLRAPWLELTEGVGPSTLPKTNRAAGSSHAPGLAPGPLQPGARRQVRPQPLTGEPAAPLPAGAEPARPLSTSPWCILQTSSRRTLVETLH